MIADLVKVKAQLEQEKFNLENAKVVLNAVKQVVFMECTKSSEFKQPRQGMASKVVVHRKSKYPKLDLGFMERKCNLEPKVPHQQRLIIGATKENAPPASEA